MIRPAIGRRPSERDHRAVAELVGIDHVFGKPEGRFVLGGLPRFGGSLGAQGAGAVVDLRLA
jgi:hypothetical protein